MKRTSCMTAATLLRLHHNASSASMCIVLMVHSSGVNDGSVLRAEADTERCCARHQAHASTQHESQLLCVCRGNAISFALTT